MTTLTIRQRQILVCMMFGLAQAETAAALGISTKTVKVHTGAVLKALGVESAHAAALKAHGHPTGLAAALEALSGNDVSANALGTPC